MGRGLFLETVGVEFEGCGLTRNQIHDFTKEDGRISVTRDASVESNVTVAGMLQLNSESALTRGLKISDINTYGYEIVTSPLGAKEMLQLIKEVTSKLREMGDYISPRASTHIHVGYAYNLNLAKKALALGLAIDPFLFSLAGLGNDYRGEINSSIFARPLEAGVAVPINSSVYHLSPEDGLDAKNLKSFWDSFFINAERTTRYHPGRYFATNLYAMLLHGTLEFRHFNQSFIAKHIQAIVVLCQCLTKVAARATLQEILDARKDISVFGMEKHVIVRHFIKNIVPLLNKYTDDFDNYTLGILLEIIKDTPTPKFSNVIPLTHISSERNRFDVNASMKKLPSRRFKDSGYRDIHNISSQSPTMLEASY